MTSRDAAIQAAKAAAAAHGWPWVEPIYTRCRRVGLIGPRRWEVMSNAGSRGQNVRVIIDDDTGAVLESHFLPR